MGTTVAVAGASGYAGGELLRLLLAHPFLTLGPICAQAAVGRAVTDLHPGLLALDDARFDATDADLLSQADLVFLALPHGESSALVADVDPGLCVVDLAGDHRLADASDWATYYGGDHAGTWTYG